MSDESVRPDDTKPNRTICPLGLPVLTGRVAFAWCSLCERVRKNRQPCLLARTDQ